MPKQRKAVVTRADFEDPPVGDGATNADAQSLCPSGIVGHHIEPVTKELPKSLLDFPIWGDYYKRLENLVALYKEIGTPMSDVDVAHKAIDAGLTELESFFVDKFNEKSAELKPAEDVDFEELPLPTEEYYEAPYDPDFEVAFIAYQES